MISLRLQGLLIVAAIAIWFAFFSEGPVSVVDARKLPTHGTQSNKLAASIATPVTTSKTEISTTNKTSKLISPSNQIQTIVLRTSLIGHQDFQGTKRDIFKASSWTPPPPPPPPAMKPAPAPAPPAPALPFVAIGKKMEAGNWEIFLSSGEQMYIVHQESLIENTYKVGKINPPNMEIIYLPLNQIQTLAIGNAD